MIRKATLFAAAGMLVAAAAMAGVPSPGNSTTPTYIDLIGYSPAGKDTTGGGFGGTIAITVRDLANNPINASSVVLDFANCPDIRFCSDQQNANYTVNCGARTVRAFTNAAGQVRFSIIGGSTSVGGGPGPGLGCARVFADGVQLGTMTATAPDLDGANGLGANDLSQWIADFGIAGNPLRGRSDYDHSGGIGANDLSQWIGRFGSVLSTTSCTVGAGVTYCP